MLLELLTAVAVLIQAEVCIPIPDDPAIQQSRIEVPEDDYLRFQDNALRSTTEDFKKLVVKIHTFVVTENRVLMVAVDKSGCIIGNSFVSLEEFVSLMRALGPNEI